MAYDVWDETNAGVLMAGRLIPDASRRAWSRRRPGCLLAESEDELLHPLCESRQGDTL
jgi:hypothetical protein